MRFLDRFRSTEASAKEVWEDYSNLLNDTLAHVNFGAEHRHRLFRMLEGTPAPSGQPSKAAAMSNIVHSLAAAATPHEYERLIKMYSKQNRPDKIHGLFLEMRRNGVQPTREAYNALIAGYVGNNDMPAATAVFDKLRAGPRVWGLEHEPDEATYALLIRGHLAQNNHFAAERLFREALARGHILAVSIWNGIMLSLLKRGRNRAAVRLFRDLQATDGLNPNLSSYRLCMAAYANSRNSDSAEKLLAEMLYPGTGKWPPPQPDYAVWRLAIRAHVAAQNLARARAALAQIPKPNADVYELVLGLACELCAFDAAQDLRLKAQAAGVRLSDATWSVELYALLGANRFQDAKKAYEAAAASAVDVAAATLSSLARAAITDGNALDFAMRIARSMVQNPNADASELASATAVVTRLCTEGRASDASTILSVADKKIPANGLAEMFVQVIKASEWEDAMALRHTFAEKAGRDCAALSIIDNAVLAVACSDYGGARALVRVQEFLNDSTSHPAQPGVAGWIALVDALFDNGRIDVVRQLHSQLRDLEGSARTGRAILGIVLERIEANEGAAHHQVVRDVKEIFGLADFGKEDVERILELVTRRAALV
ncbi:hypothetical protein HDU86_003232 [Geranomyces michiganensis]|nr:hypothetical protein HDU86_003232 [Geranomyces michiganensis]